MKIARWLYILVVGSLALAACSSPAGATVSTSAPAVSSNPTVPAVPSPTTMPPTPADAPIQPPAAAQKAQSELAARLGIQPSDVTITSIEEVEWSDSCLGAGRPDEMCAMVITPGYRVMLMANGQTYEYHTNQNGSAVRPFESPAPLGGQNPGQPHSAGEPTRDQVVAALQAALAAKLKINASDVSLVSFEGVEWPDGCLGKPARDEMCTMMITPGYRIVLGAGGKQYEYRANKSFSLVKDPDGNTVDIISAIPISLDQTGAVIDYQSPGVDCQQVKVNLDGSIHYGKCGGTLAGGQLSEQRKAELQTLLSAYRSFRMQNARGTLVFMGQGSSPSNYAEQRSVIAWATLAAEEAAGRSSAAQGLALSWHREGGIAGFCDDLAVYASGFAQASSCKGQPRSFPSKRLSAAQIDQLYQYLDNYQRFEFTQKDPAAADAMTIRMLFEGQGKLAATADDQAVIQQFAASLYMTAVK